MIIRVKYPGLCANGLAARGEVTRENAVVWSYDAAAANGNDAFGPVEVHAVQPRAANSGGPGGPTGPLRTDEGV